MIRSANRSLKNSASNKSDPTGRWGPCSSRGLTENITAVRSRSSSRNRVKDNSASRKTPPVLPRVFGAGDGISALESIIGGTDYSSRPGVAGSVGHTQQLRISVSSLIELAEPSAAPLLQTG